MAAEVHSLYQWIRAMVMKGDLSDYHKKQIVNEHSPPMLKAAAYLRSEDFAHRTRSIRYPLVKGADMEAVPTDTFVGGYRGLI